MPLDPLWGHGVWEWFGASGMLARYKEDLDGTIGHLILKWVPVIVVGVMVPFVGWLWHDREAVLARTVDLQLQIAQHAGAIANLVDVNVSQDKLHQAEIKALTDRLDIHRREIDQLHQQIIDHIVSDQRRLRNRE